MLKKTITALMALQIAAIITVNWLYLSHNTGSKARTAHLPWPGQKSVELLWLPQKDSPRPPTKRLRQTQKAEVVGLTVRLSHGHHQRADRQPWGQRPFALAPKAAATDNNFLSNLLQSFPKQVFWFHLQGLNPKKHGPIIAKLAQQWRSRSPQRLWLSAEDGSITKEFKSRLPRLSTVYSMNHKPAAKLIWDLRLYKLFPLPGEILVLPQQWLSEQEAAKARRYLNRRGKDLLLWSRQGPQRALYELWLETENSNGVVRVHEDSNLGPSDS